MSLYEQAFISSYINHATLFACVCILLIVACRWISYYHLLFVFVVQVPKVIIEKIERKVPKDFILLRAPSRVIG